MKPFTNLAIAIFILIAMVHLLRLVYGWEATVNSLVIPMWLSVMGLLIAGALAYFLWREAYKSK
ncbi:MAG TPA: hypothetical protein VK460_00605 [Burkholderiales bacterium]|nr:hypothetical protein [Burkholderiales bacterium]